MTLPSLSDTGSTELVEPSETAPARIRLLVADDHHVVLDGLSTILDMQDDMQVVAQASDGLQAVALWRRTQPDVGLIDLSMPRLSGVEAIAEIRRHEPRAKLIILTTYDGDEDLYRGLHAGAMAYLLKDATEQEVADTVRAVHRGESRMTPQIARKVLDQFRRMAATAPPPEYRREEPEDPAVLLTEKENNVLQLIAEGKSNKQIGTMLSLAEGTVKNYVSRIMEKLHAGSRTELAVIALRQRRVE